MTVEELEKLIVEIKQSGKADTAEIWINGWKVWSGQVDTDSNRILLSSYS